MNDPVNDIVKGKQNIEQYKNDHLFAIEEGRRINEAMLEAIELGEKTQTLLLRILSAEQYARWQTYLAMEEMLRQFESVTVKAYYSLGKKLRERVFPSHKRNNVATEHSLP